VNVSFAGLELSEHASSVTLAAVDARSQIGGEILLGQPNPVNVTQGKQVNALRCASGVSQLWVVP
jgi:hypothetical protein